MAGSLQCREEQRRLAEEALRANAAKHRCHFENASDVIFSYDRELLDSQNITLPELVLGYKPAAVHRQAFYD